MAAPVKAPRTVLALPALLGAALVAAQPPAAPVAPAAPAATESGEWSFAVTLDGRPIGTHRFTVTSSPGGAGGAMERTVDSSAQFAVKVLGLTVYRYRHHARERWNGDCLRELRANTDDDGQASQVEQRFDTGCLMGFAYWNPRLPTQQRLVDPQTGRTEAVRLERVPDATVPVQGQPVPAQGWRLLTGKQDITLWYARASGRWIALDALAAGGRQLSYRLPAVPTTSSAPSASTNAPNPPATPAPAS